MSLYRVSVELAGLGEARTLTERMADLIDPAPLASTLFEIPGTPRWRVDAYVEGEPDSEGLITLLGLTAGANLEIEAVPNENWVAISQAALPPVQAGQFVVHGSHDRDRVGLRLTAIQIDAGEAFGTAHHSTTEGCLIALDALARRRSFNNVLDLGSGSGVLAIAAARLLPRARIVASDIDPIAVGVARGNVRSNRAGSRIETIAAVGLAHPKLRQARRFDLVIANILAGPLLRLAPALRQVIKPGGSLVLSGILVEQAAEVLAVYAMAGFGLRRRVVLSGWSTLVLQHQKDRPRK